MMLDPSLSEFLTRTYVQQIISSSLQSTTGSSPMGIRSAFPSIRHAPSTFPYMTDLIKIQPMTASVGSIFYMNYSYGDESYVLGPGWTSVRPSAIVLGTKSEVVTRFIVAALEEDDVLLVGSDRRVIRIKAEDIKHPGDIVEEVSQ